MTVLDRPDSDIADRALRKVAYRFVPLLLVAYIFNYLDRTSLGFAALTMNRDLGLTTAEFGLAAGLFFVGYCLCEVPSNMALYRVGARRWIARIMISWGLASACTAFVVGPKSFYAVRILLGAAEAGFFPGVAFFLAAWFPPHYRTRILAWFLLGIPLSSVIGGPICGALLGLDGVLGIAGWKWLFLVVSLPCVALGVAVLFVLSDSPAQASWLTDGERRALADVLKGEVREKPRAHLRDALTDARVWTLAGVQFCFTLASYGIGIFLPLMMAQERLSPSAIGWLSAIPYVVAAVAMISWAYVVDRSGRRVFNMGLGCLVATAGLVGALLTHEIVGTLTWFTVALVGITSARGIFWSIPTRFLTGAAAAGGLAFINSLGTVGGFVGPAMMGALKDWTGSYLAGIGAMAGVMLAAMLLSASLRLVIAKE